MPLTYVDKGEFVTTSSALTSFPITRPAATVQNLIALAFVASTGIVQTPPTGFVSIGFQEVALNMRLEAFIKATTNSEPATYSFSFGASTRFGGASLILFSGGDLTAMLGGVVGTTDAGTSSTSIPCPTIDAVTDQKLVCAYAITGGATTNGLTANWFTPPAGMTERSDLSATSTTRRSLGVAHVDVATDGATGTKTAIASAAGQHDGMSVLLNPTGVGASDMVGMVGS